MSSAQTEQGYIYFTKGGFGEFIRIARSMCNDYLDFQFETALHIYQQALDKGVTTPKDCILKLFDVDQGGFIQEYRAKGFKEVQDMFLSYSELTFLLHELYRDKNGSIYKPRKASYKHIKKADKSFCIQMAEGMLKFSHDELRVDWSVSENNHSVERAYEHPLAIRIFDFLENEYVWRQRESGEFQLWHQGMSKNYNKELSHSRPVAVSKRFGERTKLDEREPTAALSTLCGQLGKTHSISHPVTHLM
ncbi:hypothetical protein [Vibrio sp. D431a]|uniref:hypothetical protein n=1 Tax=Vibrio sp. D431a TaxID=2837388 RepID=UPI0025545120|nr:hypothetical protein [Vibrio sp. D431a]MDK9793299.1 hypothetical protein [Vibrio sp. D431a]